MFERDQLVDESGLALVGEFSSMQEAHEYALVVLAMSLDCWIRMEAEPVRYTIYADPAFSVAIREEFALYAAEQEEPPAKVELPSFKSGIELAIIWIMALVLVFLKQNHDPGITERFCNSSLAFFEQGQWWRPFTALFLHGDFNHLIGNVAIGGIFCVLVAHSLGPWLGWGLILLSGLLGNIITAGVHYPDAFTSLGASTATFGALGVLVGSSACMAWKSRSVRKLGGAILPVMAGVILLGWFGTGGPQTDVLGHLFGFLTGLVLGTAALWALLRRAAAPLTA